MLATIFEKSEATKESTVKKTTVIYPESFWKEHVEKYLVSGFNKLQYCKKNDLTYHRFLHWCRKLTASNKKSVIKKSDFIPVELKQTKNSSNCLCTFEFDNYRLIIHEASVLKILLPELLK